MLLAAMLAAPLAAQSLAINVDIDDLGAAGSPTPSNAYGGAAGTPGTWNAVPSQPDPGNFPLGFPLLDVAGNPTGVHASTSTSFGATDCDDPGTSGDFGLLFDDGQLGPTLWILSGVPEGLYDVYIYSKMPCSLSRLTASVGFTGFVGSRSKKPAFLRNP
jgi:hypothetical protein